MMETNNQLILRAQGVARTMTYNEEPEGAAKRVIHELCHRLEALQADAREKGEAASGKVNGYLFSHRAIEVIVDGEIPEWMSRQPGIRVTITPVGATQPAQASEKDNG